MAFCEGGVIASMFKSVEALQEFLVIEEHLAHLFFWFGGKREGAYYRGDATLFVLGHLRETPAPLRGAQRSGRTCLGHSWSL